MDLRNKCKNVDIYTHTEAQVKLEVSVFDCGMLGAGLSQHKSSDEIQRGEISTLHFVLNRVPFPLIVENVPLDGSDGNLKCAGLQLLCRFGKKACVGEPEGWGVRSVLQNQFWTLPFHQARPSTVSVSFLLHCPSLLSHPALRTTWRAP